MIVDSSALPEQVVDDALASAFDSAGQRCSALRVLFLQEDVAGSMLDMLLGAARELVIGDPLDYATDVGPVIDAEAKTALEQHKARMRHEARELLDLPLPRVCAHGTYVAPAIYAIPSLTLLQREVFGPILHVVTFAGDRLGEVCEAINATGYGLTLGLHTRVQATADFVAERVKVGNLYVNRNQIGAVVGRAALRRRGPVRHRAKGRRPELPEGLCPGAGADHGPHRLRRQCRVARRGKR